MNNKPRFDTENAIKQRLSEGRGLGEGPTFKTWFTVPEFSSRGFRIMTFSTKFGRVIHLFSLLEYFVFIYIESRPEFVALKEGFPLSRERTVPIALRLVKKHPECFHPNSRGVNLVLTTDFIITERLKNGEIRELAWSVKPDEAFAPESSSVRQILRTAGKLQIEAIYHKEDTPPREFSIITFDVLLEKMGREQIDNLRFVRGTLRPGAMADYSDDEIRRVDEFMRPQLTTKPLNALARECDQAVGFARGRGSLRVARYLIATRKWPVDLTVPLRTAAPLSLLSV